MQTTWTAVDTYFGDLLAPQDAILNAALEANREAGLPAHDVSPLQGRLLDLIIRIRGARRVLEIGTLGGYSTIWIARAVGEQGHVTTLEVDPHHAAVARGNISAAGLDDIVELRLGPATRSLEALVAKNAAPFDFIFIDADKPNNPTYLEWALRLSRPGTVLVADNVVRGGGVADAGSNDPNVEGVRRFAELVAADPRLDATALQTVGAKGYDGFILALVVA